MEDVKTKKSKSWILGLVILIVIGLLVGMNYYSNQKRKQELEHIQGTSERIAELEDLSLRYVNLQQKAVLTLEEIDEKKVLKKRIKKIYYDIGSEGEKLYDDFINNFGD